MLVYEDISFSAFFSSTRSSYLAST